MGGDPDGESSGENLRGKRRSEETENFLEGAVVAAARGGPWRTPALAGTSRRSRTVSWPRRTMNDRGAFTCDRRSRHGLPCRKRGLVLAQGWAGASSHFQRSAERGTPVGTAGDTPQPAITAKATEMLRHVLGDAEGPRSRGHDPRPVASVCQEKAQKRATGGAFRQPTPDPSEVSRSRPWTKTLQWRTRRVRATPSW